MALTDLTEILEKFFFGTGTLAKVSDRKNSNSLNPFYSEICVRTNHFHSKRIRGKR